ncbi:hypothetical protein ACEPAI_4377 [Sanghuangporus weigelae]
MSEHPIYPPLRINVSTRKVISERQARKNVDTFLFDYQNRPGGSDAAVRTRLEKVSASLRVVKEGNVTDDIRAQSRA